MYTLFYEIQEIQGEVLDVTSTLYFELRKSEMNCSCFTKEFTENSKQESTFEARNIFTLFFKDTWEFQTLVLGRTSLIEGSSMIFLKTVTKSPIS